MAAESAKTIGVVTGWVDSAYHLRLLRAIRRTAAELELNVAIFVTAIQHDSGYWHTMKCFEPDAVDGLILVSSGIYHLDEPAQAAFLRRVVHLPSCGVAMTPPGSSGVCIDNETGLREVVRHLARHHGYRRFAFVGGPEEDEDAQARRDAFLRALAEEQIEIDPRHVLPGDFMMTGGRRAVRTLFGEQELLPGDLDVIVAANDGMARGCIEELATYGVRVPWHLAVVGFDDGVFAQQSPVPLTTVHQPFHRLGAQAVHLLASRMRGEAPEQATLPTALVVRRSCGCLEGMGRLQLSNEDQRRRGGQGFDLALMERRDKILAEFGRSTRERLGGLARNWEARLLSSFVDELKGRSPDAFRVELQNLLDHVIEHRGAPSVFHDVVSILWRHVIPCTMADPAQRTLVEGLLDGARLAISAATQRVQAGEIEANELLAERVGDACVALAASAGVDEVAEVVQHQLQMLGIRRLVLAVFHPDGLEEGLEEILRFDGRAVRLHRERRSVAQLPGSVLAEGPVGDVLVMPLHDRGAVFGVVCMEVRPLRSLVCMAIRDALSAALRPHRTRIGWG